VHIVYYDDKEKDLEKMLDGSKTMVIRGAAGRKIPHSRIFEGETLYFMQKGTFLISARAVVKSVQNYTGLSPDESLHIIQANQANLRLSQKQIQRWAKKCLCLVEFSGLETIEPLDFERQGNMDDWLIVEKVEDVLVGTSIPFNYRHSRLD